MDAHRNERGLVCSHISSVIEVHREFARLGLYALALSLPISRQFFELAEPTVTMILVAAGPAGFAMAALAFTDDRFIPATLVGVRPDRSS